MHYLYKITNQLDDRVYIGQTNNHKYRWTAHRKLARKNPVQYIHRAMAKHGTENFSFEVIATCLTKDDANETETLLIVQYNSRNKDFGYNLAKGGVGVDRTEAGLRTFIEKTSGDRHWSARNPEKFAQMKADGFNRDGQPAWNKGLETEDQPMYGKVHTEETKSKIAESHLGIGKGEHRAPKTEFKPGQKPWNAGKSRFTPDIIEEMRGMKAQGFTYTAIGKKFNSRGDMISKLIQ